MGGTKVSEQGVYVWLVILRDVSHIKRQFIGRVTLIDK